MNLHDVQSLPPISNFKVLTNYPNHAEALDLLKKLAAHVIH